MKQLTGSERVCTSSAQPQTTHTEYTHACMHAHTHHVRCGRWARTRTHRERDTRKHAHTITYHVAHSNPHTASKLLHQRVIVCGEECSALDALSKLTHNSTGYGSPVICSCPSACREKAVGETDQVNPQSQSVSGHHKWEISLPPALLSFIYHSIIHTYVRMYNIHHCHCKMRCGWRERFSDMINRGAMCVRMYRNAHTFQCMLLDNSSNRRPGMHNTSPVAMKGCQVTAISAGTS